MHIQKVCINYFMNQLKLCLFCKQHKPHSEFNKHNSKKDGLQTECRVCISNYHKEDRIKHREKRLNRDRTWRRNNKSYFNNYVKERRVNDLNFKLSANLRNATWRLFKGAGKKKDTTSEKILGVSYEVAVERLLSSIPEGYTKQDFLDGKLEVDHKIPVDWFDLTIPSELKEAGHIDNLHLIPKEVNQLKKNKYGDLDNGGIILYEEWLQTRQVPIESH